MSQQQAPRVATTPHRQYRFNNENHDGEMEVRAEAHLIQQMSVKQELALC
ncbi:hypothetical protein KDI_24170 [Dictyobacter arantiisoli]|uniref:Uncharacterized protein n=1 Tax=Dictyobacter arantiisoli TaxID=2014874 RepID=A0A5A5TCV4_9CHLR|nr:hypothetical protein KDI_24170 [Dictyobacter arantiisoli]